MSAPTDRRVVLVLGMHRSGTSALASAVHTLGCGLPDNLLPPAPDNPGGYFESKDLTRLNEEILRAAGTAWHDPSSIPEEFFVSTEAHAFRERAAAFVEKALAASPMIVLKDPRLCRLLPFWRDCLTNLEVSFGGVLIFRHPQEVARSLQVRVLTDLTQPGGLLSIARAHWLWFRYVLEAEKGSRGLPRAMLTYEMLLDDGPRQLAQISSRLGLEFPVPLETATGKLARCLQRQKSEGAGLLGWPAVAAHFYHELADQIATQGEVDRAVFESFRDTFEDVQGAAVPPNEKAIHSYSLAYASALTSLGRARATLRDDARLLFISDDLKTRGHLYRVEHHAAALKAGGLQTDWCLLDDFDDEKLPGVTIVILFRTPWDARVAALYAACRVRGITIAFDIDDLVFEPAYMREPYFDYVRTLSPVGRERWAGKVAGWRESLLEADCAIVSTAPLAAAAEKLGKRALVWPNGISWRMVEEARRLAGGRANPDGLVRLGYASGAPTHQKDFAQISAALASVLRARPDARLTIVGHLDLSEFPELTAQTAQIETRPLVPHDQLGAEYARFDINLAPLEVGNPFCEAKSELKYFEAALLQVPTVAAATEPFAAAIRSGTNGYLARGETEWRSCLLALIDDEEARRRMGRTAYWRALVRFGPEAQCLDGLAVIGELTATHYR